MSAPTFETLSAELTQALSERRGIPPHTTARCTLGRDKVMVLVEYPSKKDDGKKLATRTLDWLEKRLRQQFDMSGLPVEIADLSETAEEVAVQLYLKHLNASKPFTMRSFTWKVEDGFADLFGQPASSQPESPSSSDIYIEKDLDKTFGPEPENSAVDSATDLYADLSEGIPQTARQSNDNLLAFLVPGEAPVAASSELNLPAADLPATNDPNDRSLDFFDLDEKDTVPEPTADLFELSLTLEPDNTLAAEVVDKELVTEELFDAEKDSVENSIEDSVDSELATDKLAVNEQKTIEEATEDIRDDSTELSRFSEFSEVEEFIEVNDFGEHIEDSLLSSEPVAGSALETSESEDLVFEDLESEDAWLEDLTSEEVEPASTESEALTFEDLAAEEIETEDLTLEDLTVEERPSKDSMTGESAFEGPAPEVSAPEVSAFEVPAFEGSESETLMPEDPTVEASTSKTPVDPTIEEPEDREFVLEDLVPEELGLEEVTVRETPMEEAATGGVETSKTDAPVVDEQPIPFEYDEAEALPNVYAALADSNSADTDEGFTTEAYNDEGYEDESYEDYENDDCEDRDYEDEEDLDEDSAYYLEGDRTQPDSQIDEDIAPIEEEEVQWQREQWTQQSRTSPWLFVGLFGFLVAGVLGFVLSRPCTVGQCDRLETARTESDEALEQLRLETSADNIEAAQQKLQRSIRRLRPIPVWSSYRDEAQAAIPIYEQQLNALDLVSEAQSTAYSAAVQSQDPPHSVSTWKEIAAQWREATTALAAVPDDSPVYELAQTKLAEYRANLSTILVRVETESRAEVSLRQAQQSASQATQQAEIAASVEAWQAAAAGWETAVENLRQIPQGTQAYVEAQEMLPEFEQKLEEVRDQAEEERNASDRLSEAKQKAAEAQRAESDSLWTLAIENWNAALLDLESVGKDTSAHSEVDGLLAQYTKLWNDAGKNQEISFRFQTVEPSFFLVCGVSTVQVCTYAIKEGGVRVDLFEGYDEVINQSITPPNQRVETIADEQLVTQSNQLLQQITQLSQQAQIPVVLHDSSGEFLARYRPELDGFVRQ